MLRIIRLISFILIATAGIPALSQENGQNPFHIGFDDSVRKVQAGEEFAIDFHFNIPHGNYLYDDKTSVLLTKTEDISSIKSERPLPETHFDTFFKKDVSVYFKNFTQKIYFSVPKDAKPGRRTLEAVLRYQGCSADFCYRPVEKTVLIPIQVVSSPDTRVPISGERSELSGFSSNKIHDSSFWNLLEETDPERLLEQGKVYLLGLAFIGGILTSFTPCVLPIIPLTLAFIGVKQRKKGNLLRAALLVGGMVTMYSALGFLAASLGLTLGFLFQSRWFVLLTALFFFLFALGLFEVIPFRLPHGLQNRVTRMGGSGPFGAFLAGLTIGLIASPCVGPLIAPLLLIAARAQDRFYGFLLLLNYGFGMGLLFIVLGSAYAQLSGKIRGGKWTYRLKHLLAILMLLPGFYYAYAFAKPWIHKPQDEFWVYHFEEGLTKAARQGKPLLIDFYADWCPPCLELDKRTFSAAKVRDFAENFVMLKINCTSDDLNCRKATEKYHVIGWPSVLFAYPNGELISEIKWVGGFADQEKMLELMKQALEKAEKKP